jgi:transposase-like protein
MSTNRRRFSATFKAKVAIEALQERDTVEVLSKKHNVHPNRILRWKKEGTEHLHKVFSSEKNKTDKTEKLIDELYKQIGQLKVDNDWLKKKLS